MTFADLLTRLKEIEKHRPEVLDQPAIISTSFDNPEDSWEIDDIEFLDSRSEKANLTWEACQSGDIPKPEIVILTP